MPFRGGLVLKIARFQGQHAFLFLNLQITGARFPGFDVFIV